jgi:signal transduction histidine kinase
MLVVAAALIDPDPITLVIGSVIAAVVTAAELGLLLRRPSAVARGWALAVVELAAGAAIALVMHGGPVFFSFSCGSAAVLGVALGLRAWPIWVLQTVAGYAVVAWVIRTDDVPSALAVYLTGVPTLYVLVGLAAATARSAVLRHVRLARTALDAIERSAVAAERGRMARELHDSVEKTLRGLSFAASALPASVRRRPELAQELAETVARGAQTAADEARELLGTLRADDLGGNLAEALESVCRTWSEQARIPVTPELADAEVDLPVRHELLRITREALGNVVRHAAGVHRVWVVLTVEAAGLQLVIQDDGAGFSVPTDLTDLAAAGHYGLVGMAERAAEVGGRLRVWSDPVGGTQVVLWAPRIVPESMLSRVGPR